MKTLLLIAFILFLGFVATIAETNTALAVAVVIGAGLLTLWLVFAVLNRVFSWVGRLLSPRNAQPIPAPSVYSGLGENLNYCETCKRDFYDVEAERIISLNRSKTK